MKDKDLLDKKCDIEAELQEIAARGKKRTAILIAVVLLAAVIIGPVSHFVMPWTYCKHREAFDRFSSYLMTAADASEEKTARGVIFKSSKFLDENPDGVPEDVLQSYQDVNQALNGAFREACVTENYVLLIYGRPLEDYSPFGSANMLVLSRSGKRIRGNFYSRWLIYLGDGWYNTVYHW